MLPIRPSFAPRHIPQKEFFRRSLVEFSARRAASPPKQPRDFAIDSGLGSRVYPSIYEHDNADWRVGEADGPDS